MKNILYYATLGELDRLTYVALKDTFPDEWNITFITDYFIKEPIKVSYKQHIPKIEEYLYNNKVDLLIVTNYNHPLVAATIISAKNLHIPSIFLVLEADPTLYNHFDEVKTDYIFCWSLFQKNLFIKKLVNPFRIFITGNPIHDRFKTRAIPNKYGYKKKIVYTNISHSKFLKKLRIHKQQKLIYYYSNRDFLGLQILLENNNILFKNDIKLYIKSDNILPDNYKKLINTKNIFIDDNCNEHISSIDYLDSIFYANLVISDEPQMLLNAIMLMKQSILIRKSGMYESFIRDSGIFNIEIDTTNNVIQNILTLLDKKFIITDSQLNFYLLNYFPCSFDGLNCYRIRDAVELIFKNITILEESLRQTRQDLLNPLEYLRQEITKSYEDTTI